MHYKLVSSDPKTYVAVFQTGDELLSGLQQFACDVGLADSSFKAIGACSSVRLEWMNWETKKYETAVALDEQVELLSVIGDVAIYQGEPQVHAHVIVGKSDGTAHGGHLQEAHIRPTCEVVLTESPAYLRKQIDPKAGIPLIAL